MRIVSKFHDYYDGLLAQGQDRSIFYARLSREIIDQELKQLKLPSGFSPLAQQTYRSPQNAYLAEALRFVIGFCGQLYPVVKFRYQKSSTDPLETFFAYTAQEYANFCQQHQVFFSWPLNWSFRDSDEHSIQQYFDRSQPSAALVDLFQQFKVPVFLYGYPHDRFQAKLILNPQLREHKFMKIKDPVTAFQELSQFIGGVLGAPANPMIEISDKIKQQQAGHDHPYSFRREPQKKKN